MVNIERKYGRTMKKSFKKSLMAFLLIISTLLISACRSNNAPEDSGQMSDTSAADITAGTETETVKPDVPVITYTFEEIVEKLMPLAAWNCETTDDGKKTVDAIRGIEGTLVNCDSVEGYNGAGVQTNPSDSSYLGVGTGTLGKLINGKSAVTFSMWILPYVNLNDTFRLITLQITGKTAGFHVYYKNGGILVGGRSCSADSYTTKDYSYNLYDGTVKSYEDTTNEGRWQHVVMTLDFANDNIFLYVNGSKMFSVSVIDFSSDTFTLGSPADSDAFGGAQTSGVYSFNGVLDEIMMFDRVLTDEEILMLYQEEGDISSPATDQALINKIISRMDNDIAFYNSDSHLLYNGMIDRLSPGDYSLTTVVSGGKFYIPLQTAQKYFTSTETVHTENISGVPYCSLEELCSVNSRSLLIYGDMALVMTAQGIFDADADAVMLERMKRFFTDERYETSLNCEQTRTVVAQSGDFGTVKYCCSPTIVKVGDTIYEAMDSFGSTYVYKSVDGGKTFTNTARISDFYYATIFENNGDLYLLGVKNYGSDKNVGITKSSDGGVSWSEMKDGLGMLPSDGTMAHCSSTAVVLANGRIYKAYVGRGETWKEACRAYVISADVTSDLLSPESWTVSSSVDFKTEYFTSHKNGSSIPTFVYIEEGNVVVGPDGGIYAMYRVNSIPDPGYVVFMKLSDDNKTLVFDRNGANSVIPFNGGVTKFTVRYDDSTGLYIAFVNNIVLDEYQWQRNVLSVAVSSDMYNWEILEPVLTDRSMMNEYVSATNHGFQYVDWVIDNDDILLAVRESMGESENFHNANYLTFYRLENYRSIIDQK